MIYYTNDNFISFSEKPRKAVFKESFASIEEPIFTCFIVGNVKNVFFRNNTRCRTTTSAFAGDEKMKRKTSKNWSVNSASTEFHHHGSQYSNNASNQSAETAYKPNEVTSRQTCVVNAERISLLTTKREQEQETQRLHEQERWDYETYLISKFMRLKGILGRGPELVDLYYAGFSREEIDLIETLTDGLVSDDLEEWDTFPSPKSGRVIM